MRQRDRESTADSEPQDLFFGRDDDDSLLGPVTDERGTSRRPDLDDPPPLARRDSVRRRRGFAGLFALLTVVVLAAAGYFVGLPIYHYFKPQDYSGQGSGTVVVTVRANQGAGDIANTLERQGVIASTQAFVDAAGKNSESQSIQPGTYRLHRHMSATSALSLLLDPSSRVRSDLVVTEGATIVDVEKRLIAPPCTDASPRGTVCGLGLSKSEVTAALAKADALGLPTDFTVSGKTPSGAEGFLFPATYALDDNTSALEAVQQMVGKFTDQARTTEFTARAKALGITPYDELIIASIAQAEAKFPEDYAKVARVILNRLASNRNLQIDATSAYAAKLRGADPAKEIFNLTPGPFNTYNHPGLPPTPIGNPGTPAMNGAAHPAKGNWIYYVNGDAAGHLFFTNSEKAFTKAVEKCRTNNWGCG